MDKTDRIKEMTDAQKIITSIAGVRTACQQVLPLNWFAVKIQGLGDQFRNQSPSLSISTARRELGCRLGCQLQLERQYLNMTLRRIIKNRGKAHQFLTGERKASLCVQRCAQDSWNCPSPTPSESRQHPLWLEMQTIKVLKYPCINYLRLKSTM